MISIVIPAHNEEAYLPRTLEALKRQNYPNFEIIVVANGCTDATVEVARDRCKRLIVLSQKNLGVARNLGARMAKGDLIVFLDADTHCQRDTLRRLVEPFSDETIAGVSGHAKVGNLRTFIARCQALEYTCGFNLDRRAYKRRGSHHVECSRS